MGRVFCETFAYADTAAFTAAVAAGSTPWEAGSTLTGLAIDTGTTYDGHATLKYDPVAASGTPAVLLNTLGGGFHRAWLRVVLLVPSTLYDGGEPAIGSTALPVSCALTNGTQTAVAGMWDVVDAGGGVRSYRHGASVTTVGGTVTGTEATGLGLASLAALGTLTWDVLIEREGNGLGSAMRLRGWRAGTLALDQRLTPADTVDLWSTLALTLTTGVTPAADDVFHVGEVTLWDADRLPDPYGYGGGGGVLFVDPLADTSFGITTKYEYGDDVGILNDGTGPTGPLYIWTHANNTGLTSFVGKDLETDEPEVTAHFWWRPQVVPGELEVVVFKAERATGTDRAGNNSAQARLTVDNTGTLRVYRGATLVATCPTTINVARGNLTTDFYIVRATCRATATGFFQLVMDGVETWYVSGNFDNSGFGVIPSVVISDSSGSLATFWSQDIANIVLTRGLAYPGCMVEFLPPNGDGSDTAWTITNSGQVTTPAPTMWEAVWQSMAFEPDEEFTMISSATAAAKASVLVSPLPDSGCGGLIGALCPIPNIRTTATTGVTHAQPFLRSGGSLVDTAELTDLRHADPPTEPFAGDNGFVTYCARAVPLNPATGDQWDAGDLTALEVGMEVVDNELQLSTYGVAAILVRPTNLAPAGGGVMVMRNGQWRQPTAAWQMRNGEWRPLTTASVMRNGQYRTASIVSAGLPPYCPDGPVAYPFVDDFAGRWDSRRWEPVVDVAGYQRTVSGGLVKFTGPSSGVAFPGFENSITSKTAMKMTGGFIQAEPGTVVVADANRVQVLAWLVTLNGSVNDYFGWRYRNLNLEVYGPSGVQLTKPFVPGDDAFWRIEHDAGTGALIFRLSPDGTTWTTWYTWTSGATFDASAAFFKIGVANIGTPPADVTTGGEFKSVLTSAVAHV